MSGVWCLDAAADPDIATGPRPRGALLSLLDLERSPGEGRDANGVGELCFSRALGRHTLLVQREYPEAAWGWMLLDGEVAIAFGDGVDRDDAERQLSEAVAELRPDLLPPAPAPPLLFDAGGRPFGGD